jgi:hypothetical protein
MTTLPSNRTPTNGAAAALAYRHVCRAFIRLARAVVTACLESARFLPALRDMPQAGSRELLARLLAWTRSVIMAVDTQMAPLLRCWLFERTLVRSLRAGESSGELSDADRCYLRVTREDLQESHEIELTRRAAIQQRVQGNAATIAVVTGLLAGALALLNDELFKKSNCSANLLRLLLTCAVIWLVMSGLSAIRVVGIIRQWDHWLQTRDPPDKPEANDEREKTKLVKMILLNQGYTMIAANYATASHICMRNAFMAIGLVVVVVLWFR